MLRARNNTKLVTILIAGVAMNMQAQNQTVTLTVNDPRPVAAAAVDIERRSGIAVNYEDVRYEYPADLQDVTDQIMTPAQRAQALPGVRVIVPLGGQLSAPTIVDQSNRFPDLLSVTAAVNSILAAYSASPHHSGAFMVEATNGVVYIEPSQMRNASGTIVSITPLLSTPITFSAQQRTCFETLRMILSQVSAATGFTVNLGTVPPRALATEVTIGANRDSASHVITTLLASVNLQSNRFGPALSYRMLFDPKSRGYGLNIHPIPSSTPPYRQPEPTPSAPTDGRWHHK